MTDQPANIAIDLGAESCRVSLLQWTRKDARIRIVRRFANAPCERAGELHWDIDRICAELATGLHKCAELAPEGIASIGVTGWAVDCVRLGAGGRPLCAPFCYRDTRTHAAMQAVHALIPADELYARTGVQIEPINTLYQLYADKLAGTPDSAPWINLPEYILHWLGAPAVAEYTNATHTGLIDPETRQWWDEAFDRLGLDRNAAPKVVAPGAVLGKVSNALFELPAFRDTVLIAPACHDTASAVAGIPKEPGDWMYISSGTWSLVGIALPECLRTQQARDAGFTNLGAAGSNALFHRALTGMWLLRQCLNTWYKERAWGWAELIEQAEKLDAPDQPLDVEDQAFIAPGDMPSRINRQRTEKGLPPLPSGCDAAPLYANLVFHSLAAHYAKALHQIAEITGRTPTRICVVGGGSRNEYLNRLTEQAAGVPVERCSAESSTVGNFAVQLAALEQNNEVDFKTRLATQAQVLTSIPIESAESM